ncbi:hypothetical protein BVC80_8831g24 [Macleaya cordata]|uniref:Uncharacterized protein n=1 Tax=Macleaya cordata TaxID=56857 RepID=A0A200RE22_MACCD|nr:hypothetical protein BVC80_8831g24 [Macleaya cordata]
MHSISSNKSSSVQQMWKKDNGNKGWDLELRRDLNDWEFDELFNILKELEQIRLNRELEDDLV